MKPNDPQLQSVALGLLGAVLGSVIGYFVFSWAVRQGFYALVLPPALLGFGAGLLAKRRIVPLAVVCGVAGLALGLFLEWHFFPFSADQSLSYFLAHVHKLRPLTLIMIALGAYLSYRFALGKDQAASKPN
jgi:hypothetical protein